MGGVSNNKSRTCEFEDCDIALNDVQRKFCSTQHRWQNGNRRKQKSLKFVESTDPSGVSRIQKLDRIQQLLADNGVDLDEVGSVRSVRLNEWSGLAKGEMVESVDPETGKVSKHRAPTRVVDMKSASIVLHPSWATGPRWNLPKPPAPLKVSVPARKGPTLLKGWKSCLLVPDPQFGFRRDLFDASVLDPFHDERALDIALQVADIERPDGIIFLGDVLDFASFGKYRQEAAFALTVQPTIEAAHDFIAKMRAYSKWGRFIEGNHDARLANEITDNAKAAFGIKRAGAPPAEWPVMSVPFLLNLDQLGIEYVGGYPAGATYINDNIAAIHGRKVGNDRRSAATMVVEDERVSVVFGHVHRIETTYRTRNTRGKPKISVAHTPGCLCRIDGAVPGVKGGTDAFGRAITSWENWQQGLTIVRYQDGDGKFAIENILIAEGWATHGGQEFVSRIEPAWAA